jgi:broad specificity phosphatase PhoE
VPGELTITFIRHGETEWNAAGRVQGQADVPLSERGREQARLLGERLRGAGFDSTYTSDLSRAAETARLALPGAPAALEPRLREQDVGDLDGLTWKELLSGGSPMGLEWLADPLQARPPGGETFPELVDRYQEWRGALPAMGHVAAVTHGGLILAALWTVIGAADLHRWRFELRPTSLTTLRFGAQTLIERVGDAAHLERGQPA